jgi:hypothetical protein
MLTELKALHEALSSKIAKLDDVMSQAQPDRSELANVRMELSKASTARLRYIESVIYPYLMKQVSDADARRLRDLRLENAALRASSTKHVGIWTIEKVMADWTGYRRASSEMRQAMQQRISAEANLLYSLLEKHPPSLSGVEVSARG